MNITPAHPAFGPVVGAHTDDTQVVWVAERMQAAAATVRDEDEIDFPLWPIEGGLAYQDAFRRMVMQPFIEFLFYGEEEETGNVTLSTML